MTFVYIIGLISLPFLFFRYRNWRTEIRQRTEFKKVFDKKGFNLPTLDIGTTYWWATFTVTFSHQEDYEAAEKIGLFDEFKNRIRSFYDSEFDPDRAVNFTYPGQKPWWEIESQASK